MSRRSVSRKAASLIADREQAELERLLPGLNIRKALRNLLFAYLHPSVFFTPILTRGTS